MTLARDKSELADIITRQTAHAKPMPFSEIVTAIRERSIELVAQVIAVDTEKVTYKTEGGKIFYSHIGSTK